MKKKIKTYLSEHNITSTEELNSHVDYLRNKEGRTMYETQSFFDLVGAICNKKAELDWYFLQNKKESNWEVYKGVFSQDGTEVRFCTEREFLNKVEEAKNTWKDISEIFSGQPHSKKEGIKETEGKLNYEFSWEFIEEMAQRMANNKSDKYPPFNWKKPMDVEKLKQATNRHHIEVMKGNYRDGEEELGHVVSYACNAMMLWYQLKNKL